MKILIRCVAVAIAGTAIVAGLQYIVYKMYEKKVNKDIVAEDQREA